MTISKKTVHITTKHIAISKIFTAINININIWSITFAEITLFFPSQMLIFTKSAIFIKNGNFL